MMLTPRTYHAIQLLTAGSSNRWPGNYSVTAGKKRFATSRYRTYIAENG